MPPFVADDLSAGGLLDPLVEGRASDGVLQHRQFPLRDRYNRRDEVIAALQPDDAEPALRRADDSCQRKALARIQFDLNGVDLRGHAAYLTHFVRPVKVGQWSVCTNGTQII